MLFLRSSQAGRSINFRRLFYSFLIILLLPMLLATSVYIFSLSRLRDTVRETNQANVQMMALQLDQQFTVMENIVEQIFGNTDFQALAAESSPYDASKRMTANAIQQQILSYLTANPAINDIFIYFSNSDMLLSKRVFYVLENTDLISQIMYGMDTDALRQLMTSPYYGKLVAIGEEDSQHLYYLCSSSAPALQKTFSIMLDINISRIHQLLRAAGQDSFILLPEGEMLCDTANTDSALIQQLSDIMPEDSGLLKPMDRYLIRQDSDALSGVAYLRLIAKDEYYEPLRGVWVMIIIYFIATPVLGFFITSKLARRNYAGVEQLVQKLQQVAGQSKPGSDDFQYIQQIIGQLLEERNEINRLQIEHKNASCNGILGRVLKGRQYSLEQFWRECEAAGEPLPREQHFILAVLRIDDGVNLFFEPKRELDNWMIDTIFMMTSNILQELVKNAGFTPFIHETDGYQATLVPITDGGETYFQQMIAKIQEAANTVCRIMKDDFCVQISVIISGVETGLAGIAEAYERMLGLMTLRDLREGEYPPVTLLKGRTASPQRLLIRKSIEQIHVGDYAGAKESLNSLCGTSNQQPEPQESPCSGRKQLVEEVCRYIDRQCLQTTFSLGEVSENFHISSSYLSQIFKKELGYSPLDYVQKKRLETAKQLLDKGASVKEAAVAAGYYDTRPMIRAFRRYEGITPSEYRSGANTGEN